MTRTNTGFFPAASDGGCMECRPLTDAEIGFVAGGASWRSSAITFTMGNASALALGLAQSNFTLAIAETGTAGHGVAFASASASSTS